jgi:hypothetical protein
MDKCTLVHHSIMGDVTMDIQTVLNMVSDFLILVMLSPIVIWLAVAIYTIRIGRRW